MIKINLLDEIGGCKCLNDVSTEILGLFVSNGLRSTLSDVKNYYRDIEGLIKDIEYDIKCANEALFHKDGFVDFKFLPVSVESGGTQIVIRTASDEVQMDNSKLIHCLFFNDAHLDFTNNGKSVLILLYDNGKQVRVNLQFTSVLSFNEEDSPFVVKMGHHPTYQEFLPKLIETFPEYVIHDFYDLREGQCGNYNGVEELFQCILDWEKLDNYKVDYSVTHKLVMNIYQEYANAHNYLDFTDMILLAYEILLDEEDINGNEFLSIFQDIFSPVTL